MSLLFAHAGHWLVSVGFAGAPLTVIAGIGFLVWRERRESR